MLTGILVKYNLLKGHIFLRDLRFLYKVQQILLRGLNPNVDMVLQYSVKLLTPLLPQLQNTETLQRNPPGTLIWWCVRSRLQQAGEEFWPHRKPKCLRGLFTKEQQRFLNTKSGNRSCLKGNHLLCWTVNFSRWKGREFAKPQCTSKM